MRAVGYLVILSAAVVAMGNLMSFIDVPTFVVVVGLAAWSLLVTNLKPGSRRALNAALGTGQATESDLQAGFRLVRAVRVGALAGGGLAATAGLIRMLTHLDEPAQIGPGMAMLLLGLLYAVLLAYFILLPLQAGVERRLVATGGHLPAPETPMDLMVLVGGLALSAVTFAVLVV